MERMVLVNGYWVSRLNPVETRLSSLPNVECIGQTIFLVSTMLRRNDSRWNLPRAYVGFRWMVDLLYLHSPDRITPIEESAEALSQIAASGKARYIALSNATLDETQRFQAVCPITAIQPRYNMLQREIESDLVPWCIENDVAVVGYWPLMKGLLAGKIRRDFQFDPNDKRQPTLYFNRLNGRRPSA